MQLEVKNRLKIFMKKRKQGREKERKTWLVYKEKAEREAARCGMYDII